MGPALFAITLEAMKSEVDEVALQGKIPILMCRDTLPGEITPFADQIYQIFILFFI